MPTSSLLRVVQKLSEAPSLVKPLMKSWFDLVNYMDVPAKKSETTSRILPPLPLTEPSEGVHALAKSSGEVKQSINSILKIRLYPIASERLKLEHMFASNRAVHNKLVARSKDDCKKRLVLRGKETTEEKMSLGDLGKKYRPIVQSSTMKEYFRKKKSVKRHLQVQDEVRDSAFRDFTKAVKSSLAFFALKKKGKTTTFPALMFKRKLAPSNTIEMRARGIGTKNQERGGHVRFHPVFFGFAKSKKIKVRENIPDLHHSVRLQRLREGEYYLAIPRSVKFAQTESPCVCAIDPNIRSFITVYNPDGRTFSVKIDNAVLLKRFQLVDKLKSKLALMDNESKAKHSTKIRTRTKAKSKKKKKTKLHRKRYRLRRSIRYIFRRVTRLVSDMHHKVSSWLASSYQRVLLPSFQTSEMVRKHTQDTESDAAPAAAPAHEDQIPQRSGIKRMIRNPTARAMLALSHYKFKMLLQYKMARVGGRVIECEEEYTSKTCSRCGNIKHDLGGNSSYRCSACQVVLDRDVNTAKNIFHMNMGKV